MSIPALVLEWLELRWRSAAETRSDCAKRIQQAPLTNASDELVEEWKTLRQASGTEADVLQDLLQKLREL